MEDSTKINLKSFGAAWQKRIKARYIYVAGAGWVKKYAGGNVIVQVIQHSKALKELRKIQEENPYFEDRK